MKRLRLRRWQKQVLDLFLRERPRDLLIVASPGAGKTVGALTLVLHNLRDHPHRPVFVVTPTRQLKQQWADEAALFDLQLEPNWRGGPLPPDAHGIVTTYAQVATQAKSLGSLADDGIVIMDEVHHAGDDEDLAWGEGLKHAFATSSVRLAVSGTPFRRDDAQIPFVDYDAEGEAQADFVYGYADALDDGGVVRPVYFPRIGGEMEWTTPEGVPVTATFDDALTRDLTSQRLRTALDPSGGWMRDALRQAHDRLTSVRKARPDAGGIVFCVDQGHARAVARILKDEMGASAVVAVSDDADSDKVADEFRTGTTQWICSVRKTSEGYDAKRLAVAVYATNVTSPLYFQQAVGRVIRWRDEDGPRQAAWVYIPDDPRLRALAFAIKDQLVHVIGKRKDARKDDEWDEVPPPERGEQVSLFAAISSSASSVSDDAADDDGWDVPALGDRHPDDPTLEIDVPPPPRTAAQRTNGQGPSYRRREELRAQNHDRVVLIARLTGLGHQEINSRLNRDASVSGGVSKASIAELERRLKVADRWLASV